ncbi:MAG: hypothetical protein R3C28_11040 [Pirellulaceae bacterium]
MSMIRDAQAAARQLFCTSQAGLQVLGFLGGSLECCLLQVNPLGCEFDYVQLECSAVCPISHSDFLDKANRLAASLNYLLEPISVIELDANQQQAILRSTKPQAVTAKQRRYYEIAVQGNSQIRFARFESMPGQARQRVPAVLTREVFVRLIGDLASVFV